MNQFLVSAIETAKALCICQKTLWTLTQTKGLPCVRIGRRVLYDPRDVQAWIDRQKFSSSLDEENPMKKIA